MRSKEYFYKFENDLEYQQEKDTLKTLLNIAEDILEARLERGMSQTELARLAGTKQSNISRLESGIGNPTIALLERIGKALNVKFVARYEKSTESQRDNHYSRTEDIDITDQSPIIVDNWPQTEDISIKDQASHTIYKELICS